jgi:hypothetical protein
MIAHHQNNIQESPIKHHYFNNNKNGNNNKTIPSSITNHLPPTNETPTSSSSIISFASSTEVEYGNSSLLLNSNSSADNDDADIIISDQLPITANGTTTTAAIIIQQQKHTPISTYIRKIARGIESVISNNQSLPPPTNIPTIFIGDSTWPLPDFLCRIMQGIHSLVRKEESTTMVVLLWALCIMDRLPQHLIHPRTIRRILVSTIHIAIKQIIDEFIPVELFSRYCCIKFNQSNELSMIDTEILLLLNMQVYVSEKELRDRGQRLVGISF